MMFNKIIFILIIFLFLIPLSCAENSNIPDTQEKYPLWSPDGQTILFDSTGVMSEGIFIIRPDGTNLQKIASKEWDASWSPNGTKVIMIKNYYANSDFINSVYEIALLDIETKNITRITYNKIKENKPKYSPDGKKITFEAAEGIYTLNYDGTDLKKIVDNAASPKWSPDSKKIAYYTIENLIEIWVINSEGTDNKKIFIDYRFKIGDRYRWTPDSKYLLLNNGSTTITKVNIDNTSDIEYIYDPVAPLNPEYSPDGNYITFISNRDGGDYDLFVARSNGSDLYRLVYDTNPKTPFDPDYFYKISRPTPPPWPTPEPTPEVTSTAGPADTSEAGRTPSIPGFTALVMVAALVSSVIIKKAWE